MWIEETSAFTSWISSIKDMVTRSRIHKYIDRVRLAGHLIGDFKPVGGGVIEIRLHFGPGYRLYVVVRSATLVILLIGGDKSTQASDIETAKRLALEL